MLLLMQFLGSNKPSPSQPALNNKCSYNSTSSHLQEARAQVPGHSIRADWSKHSNSVGGGSLEQNLPQIVFHLPGRRSNRATPRRSAHPLEVGQVKLFVCLSESVDSQVGSKAWRSVQLPTLPWRRGRSSQPWPLPGLCPGASEQPIQVLLTSSR